MGKEYSEHKIKKSPLVPYTLYSRYLGGGSISHYLNDSISRRMFCSRRWRISAEKDKLFGRCEWIDIAWFLTAFSGRPRGSIYTIPERENESFRSRLTAPSVSVSFGKLCSTLLFQNTRGNKGEWSLDKNRLGKCLGKRFLTGGGDRRVKPAREGEWDEQVKNCHYPPPILNTIVRLVR